MSFGISSSSRPAPEVGGGGSPLSPVPCPPRLWQQPRSGALSSWGGHTPLTTPPQGAPHSPVAPGSGDTGCGGGPRFAPPRGGSRVCVYPSPPNPRMPHGTPRTTTPRQALLSPLNRALPHSSLLEGGGGFAGGVWGGGMCFWGEKAGFLAGAARFGGEGVCGAGGRGKDGAGRCRSREPHVMCRGRPPHCPPPARSSLGLFFSPGELIKN